MDLKKMTLAELNAAIKQGLKDLGANGSRVNRLREIGLEAQALKASADALPLVQLVERLHMERRYRVDGNPGELGFGRSCMPAGAEAQPQTPECRFMSKTGKTAIKAARKLRKLHESLAVIGTSPGAVEPTPEELLILIARALEQMSDYLALYMASRLKT